MNRKLVVRVSSLGIAALVAGCATTPSESPSAPRNITPPPGMTAMTAAQTAVALMNPSTATTGAWSVLDHLHIGVYSAAGSRVLAGSETGPHSFYLFDFTVPLLGALAHMQPSPFSAYVATLARVGFNGDAAHLLALYRSTYAKHSSTFLVELLTAMGMQFTGNPQVTPIEQWLLFLDTFVPPNGAAARTVAVARSVPLLTAATPCSGIVGVASLPSGWGIVYGSIDFPNLLAADVAYLDIYGRLLAAGTTVQITAMPAEVDEGVHMPGGTVTLTAHVTSDFTPVAVPIACGVLQGLGLPFGGAAENVGVSWTIASPDIESHGMFTEHGGSPYAGLPQTTDAGGDASLLFTAREDPLEGQGSDEITTGVVTATVDLTSLLERHGLAPQLAQYVAAFQSPPAVFTVLYHSGGYDAKVNVACPVPSGNYMITFTGRFTPDPNHPGFFGGTFAEVTTGNGGSIGPVPVPLTMSTTSGPTPMLLIQASHLISPVDVPIAGGTGAGTEDNCPFSPGSVTATVKPVAP
jgi:hypothetical protein